jgi:hypothetical protein
MNQPTWPDLAEHLAAVAAIHANKPAVIRFECGEAAYAWIAFNHDNTDSPQAAFHRTHGAMFGVPVVINVGMPDRHVRAVGYGGETIREWETPTEPATDRLAELTLHFEPMPTDNEPAVSAVKLGHTVKVPAELLADAATPPADEKSDLERIATERDLKLGAAQHRLAQLADPLTRTILDLHSVDKYGECGGCDFGGYEAEPPEWPCRTVTAVAEHHGIELP